MTMKTILFIITATLVSLTLRGQNIEDVLRYSILNPVGSAASVGVGSVGGSFGGDYSTIHINPAGLADFRDDKFVITPMLSVYNGEAQLVADPSSSDTDGKTRFGVANIGYVSTSTRPGKSVKRFNVAIGFSRMADFNGAVTFSGRTPVSYLDYLVFEANNAPDNLNPFDTQLAEEAGALIYRDDFGDFVTDLYLDSIDVGTPIYKEQEISTSGSLNEMNLTLAGKAGDKLNFGFHLGIPILNFNQTKSYVEEGPANSLFQSLRFIEDLSTSGVGVNFKAGLQYAIIPQWRIGLAAHTPTVFALTDDFINTLDYTYTDPDSQASVFGTSTSPDGTFRYRVTNPWRFIASTGILYELGEARGFLSGDLEYVDYRSASIGLGAFSGNAIDELDSQIINRQIDDELATTINFRLGTELAINKVRFRLGLGLRDSPFEADGTDYSTDLSAGLGFRSDGFFLDLGFRRFSASQTYFPYFDGSVDTDPQVDIDRFTNNLVVTTGFSF